MSKTDKNYIKKNLKINTDNFGFSLSHHTNKSTNFFSVKQKVITTPPLKTTNNINNNINNQFKNNNINIINININSNYNNNKENNINNYTNTNITNLNNNVLKNPFIKFIKQNSNLNSNAKYYIQKKIKMQINQDKEENINNYIKNDKKIKKEENIKSSTSMIESEKNSRNFSFKINDGKKSEILPIETPRQMIISYFDIKNILNKKYLKLEFKKKEKIPRTANTEYKNEVFNNLNKDKKIVVTKKINKNLVSNKHQSQINLLNFKNNYIYINKNIKKSSSFLNKNLFNNLDNSRKNNDSSINDKINSVRYLKTSSNIALENNKRIRHYYTKNEIINIDKNNICKDKLIRREKNKSLNNNMNPSFSMINSSNKSKNF